MMASDVEFFAVWSCSKLAALLTDLNPVTEILRLALADFIELPVGYFCKQHFQEERLKGASSCSSLKMS